MKLVARNAHTHIPTYKTENCRQTMNQKKPRRPGASEGGGGHFEERLPPIKWVKVCYTYVHAFRLYVSGQFV